MTPVVRVLKISKKFHLKPLRRRKGKSLSEVFSAGVFRPGSPAVSEEFWALRDISFDVFAGERVVFTGPNGSGKSTLFKILNRVIFPTAGRAEIFGKAVAVLENGVGFHPELTGRENVFLNGAILGMKASGMRKHFDSIVNFSEIEAFIDIPVKFYSSGMSGRLAFSIAVHLPSDILFFDEVFSSGDASFRNKSKEKILSLSREGKSILLISHDAEIASSMASRVIALKEGKMVAS